MSLPRLDMAPVDPARNVADEDPLSRPGAQHKPPQASMDGSQLVQWLSIQAGNMAGNLQHTVRALMVRASSPMPVSDGRDEVSTLKKQLHHQQQAHKELQTMLQNQALATASDHNNKWAKPLPRLDLPARLHLQKASKTKQIWELWSVNVALAVSTWNDIAVTYWHQVYTQSEDSYQQWPIRDGGQVCM